jgi:acyl-CoA thioester hydrolase
MERSKYEKTLTVELQHIDELNHVNNVVYLQWIQDISKEHWFKYAAEELNQKYYWVVTRHEIDYRKPCLEGEELTILTWVGELEAIKWPRHVQILKPDGKVAVESKTDWCLIDSSTHRPTRISEEIVKVFL